jgi:N-acetylneuraminic acid mutarotase
MFKNFKVIATFAFFLGVFLLFPSDAKAACSPFDNPCWSTGTAMQTSRRDFGVASDSAGKIYAVGGFDSNGQFSSVLEMYDPSTDTWTTKTSAPVGRNDMGFAFDKSNGKFYFGGGYDGSVHNDFFEYDPTTDAWTTKASLPTGSAGLRFASASNGKLYSIGGGYLDGTYVSNVYEYDPSTDSWTTKSAIPTPRSDAGLVAAGNGKMYLMGGGALTSHGLDFISNVDEYNPSTDTWASKSAMSLNRYDMGASITNGGKILVIGGGTDSGYTDLVEQYDPSTDTWTTQTSLPNQVFALGEALGNDGKIHVLGGQTASSDTTSTHYVGTITSTPQLTALSPADVYIKKALLDLGVKFDLKAEVYKDSTLISSGELTSVNPGSSATHYSIPFSSFSAQNITSGSVLNIKVYARNACSGSLLNSGTATLFYNASSVDSKFGATINSTVFTYHLLDGFVLGSSSGSSQKSISVAAGTRCSAYKLFGTWSTTL